MNLLRELALIPVQLPNPKPVTDIMRDNTTYIPNEDGALESDEVKSQNRDSQALSLTKGLLQWISDNQSKIETLLSAECSEDEETLPNNPSQGIPPESGPSQASPTMDPNGLEIPPEGDSSADTDPNHQGTIRTVPNAHLVYKRKMDDGMYNELWIFNMDEVNSKDFDIRNEILRGTDIAPNSTSSEDGSQTYELWSIGNAQLMLISGLAN